MPNPNPRPPLSLRRLPFALVFCIAMAAGAQTSPAARRPLQFADMMKMRRLGDIAVSPDGKWLL